MLLNFFINFSDAAKYADVARHIIYGLGYGTGFSFWTSRIFEITNNNIFTAPSIPPVMPYSIAAFFNIFGVGDFAVIATSFFYFILILIFVYLLGKKIFNSKLVGALSALAIGFNYDLIHYATSGASESPFIFEIVAASFFASIKKKWAIVVTILFLILMYFTRPQAFIYIAGIILYWLLINFKPKRALITFVGVVVIGLLVDHFVLGPLSGKFFLYSVTGRALSSSFDQSSTASNALRGASAAAAGGIIQTLKNIFYNLYNFYKALPDIINPYLFGIFALALFLKSKSKEVSSFKIASLFMVVATLLVTAASIPFYRYIHPIIPFVYIIAVGTVVEIITNFQFRINNQIKIFNNKISKHLFTILSSSFFILFFGIGQTIGILVLDSRFEAKTHNMGKPPVYVELSYILRDNTDKNQVVVTNLDTWGSWYGERKTVWFPLKPEQLIPPEGQENLFDAIYLTSYLIDDENYYMGDEWRQIFYNPENPENEFIAENYELKEIIEINSEEVYEKQDVRAVLLVKKRNTD